MKEYKLIILTGGGYTIEHTIIADYYSTTTSNGSSSNCYRFYIEENNRERTVSSYPIDKTIIKEIITK